MLTIGGETVSVFLWLDTTIRDGSPVPITRGVVLFWGTDTAPERLSCVGTGSTVSRTGTGLDSVMTVRLSNLSGTRSCPGTPIAGSLGVGLPPI
jgi:hypothetical protein